MYNFTADKLNSSIYLDRTNNFPVSWTFFGIGKKKRKIICSDLFNRNYLKFSIFSKFLVVKTKNRKIIYPVFLDVFWYRKKKRKIICSVEVDDSL